MARRNSSGPERSRRGPSSAGKPFKKSKGGSGGKSSGKPSKGPRGFSSKRSFDSSGEGASKPFSKRSSGGFGEKRSTRPYTRSSDSSGEERRGSKPFPKRSSGGFGDEKRPARPYTKRTSDSGDERRGSKPFTKRSSGDFGHEKKPFSKRSSGGFRGDKRSPRSFSDDANDAGNEKRSRPFSKRSSDNFKDDNRSVKRTFNKADLKRTDKNSGGAPSRREQGDRPSGKARHGSDEGFKKRGAGKGKEQGSYNEEAPLQTEKIRLNRFIANSGVCSRREADQLILMGLISVNGKTISELGYKVNPGDEVRHEGKLLRAEKPVYVLMNKPKGFLTTTSDPQERNTVMHILGNAIKERIYPVGRLDRNTTGLLLLTNDGDLADKLMHPSYNAKKIYKVELDRPLAQADFEKIREGVHLEEGRAMVDDLAVISDDGKTVGVEIHIGWNRVVRRIFETLEYTVIKLDRSVYAGLDKKDLPRGHWRFLTKEEVVRLKHYNK